MSGAFFKRYQLIRGFAGGVKRYFYLASLASCLSILFQFLIPQVIGFTVDSVIGSKAPSLPGWAMRALEAAGGRETVRGHPFWCAGAVVLLAGLGALFDFLSRSQAAKASETCVKRLRQRLFEHIQHLPFSWHVQSQTGDVIQRCTSDMDVVREFLSRQVMEVLRTLVLIAVALTLMFSMNVKLALTALAFIPLILLYSMIFYSVISKKFRRADEAEGELMVKVQENLTGMRVVRAFGREKNEVDRFDCYNNRFTQLWINLGYTLGAYWGIGDVVTSLQLLSSVAFGAVLAARGEITLGEYLIFCSYNNTLAWPVRTLGRILAQMSKAGVSADRIGEILSSPPEPPEPDALRPPMDKDLTFENVSFGYRGEPVLKNLSFTVKGGTTFGILGATGSGKSTLVSLLNRLFDLPPENGRILIGGTDLQKIDRFYLRRNVGLVLQEPFLFSKTIHENIAIAAPSARDAVRVCAHLAAVDQTISDFPRGYDTVVGERGVTLSGGQKQRVAIARTLLLDPPVLIFDDSLSAVDMETDELIRGRLKALSGTRTIILISHRINTLMDAHQVLVLDNGEVEAIGSHRELINREGTYRRIYEIQTGTASEEGRHE